MENQTHLTSPKEPTSLLSASKPSLMNWVEALLKAPKEVTARIQGDAFNGHSWIFWALALACYFMYGLIVGSFSGGWQLWQAPLRMVTGIVFTAFLCFPSLYVFLGLSGSTVRPAQAWSLFAAAHFLSALLLLAFAPIAFVFTFSIQYAWFMGFIHWGIWIISMMFGLRYLNTAARQFDAGHAWFLRLWALIFFVTSFQMATLLRPILESSDVMQGERVFFLEHWVKNLVQLGRSL